MSELRCDMPGALMLEALTLLDKDPRNINRISLDAQIPSGWLRMLENHEIKSPSVNRIEYLINHLNEFKANNK